MWKVFQYQSQNNLTEKGKSSETPYLRRFRAEIPLFELGVFFVVLNYFCLSFMQIHAYFYINYIIYNGLLIFCCQNVAMIFLLICYHFHPQVKKLENFLCLWMVAGYHLKQFEYHTQHLF